MSDQFFKTREKTEAWLEKMGVEGYTIRADLTVDVAGSVNISDRKLTYIPVQFGVVDGGFKCSRNKLTRLLGSPVKSVSFDCERNQLTSLDGAPNMVSDWFDCEHNQLTSLQGAPRECADFFCSHNQLTDLIGLPDKLAYIYCTDNPRLADISAAPDGCRVHYDHDVVSKNQAAWQLAKLGAGNDISALAAKPGRVL